MVELILFNVGVMTGVALGYGLFYKPQKKIEVPDYLYDQELPEPPPEAFTTKRKKSNAEMNAIRLDIEREKRKT